MSIGVIIMWFVIDYVKKKYEEHLLAFFWTVEFVEKSMGPIILHYPLVN